MNSQNESCLMESVAGLGLPHSDTLLTPHGLSNWKRPIKEEQGSWGKEGFESLRALVITHKRSYTAL